MERAPWNLEKFIINWNQEFPNLQLTVEFLKHPAGLMEAIFHVFESLGIDRDAITKPPPEAERDEHMIYYWDLLPIINTIRVTKHLMSMMQQADGLQTNLTVFLSPSATSSHHILVVLVNFTIFIKSRYQAIQPYEDELHSKKQQVVEFEDKKNKLIELLNIQAEEKGKRKERITKLNEEIENLEKALKEEKEPFDIEKQETDVINKELHHLKLTVEQKKTQRDAIMAEVNYKKTHIVNDAEDVRAQVEQASRNFQEADDKLNSLKDTLKKKENDLKNLQTIKPVLETAINIFNDIDNSFKCLQEYEQDNEDSENDDESVLLLKESQVSLARIEAARDNTYKKRQEIQAKRQNQKETLQSALREAEDNDRKYGERYKKTVQRVAGLKEDTRDCERERNQGLQELERMTSAFKEQVARCEGTLTNKLKEAQAKIETKLNAQAIKDQILQLDIDK